MTDADEAEIQRATCALLVRPLMTAEQHPEEVRLVRRHGDALVEFFREQVGWILDIERDVVRLRKQTASPNDATRPARAKAGDPPFTRRRYVLLCLCLVELHEADRQITLRRLADGVAEKVVLDQLEIEFELKGREQRRDLVAAVRWLIERGVLRRIEGNEDGFVNRQGDVLYVVERAALTRVLVSRTPPSSVDASSHVARVAALVPSETANTDALRRLAMRRWFMRRLLDDPVLYYDQMSEEQRAYVQRSRVALGRVAEKMTGLILEVRAEGLALVDPVGRTTDLALPEEGTDGHATLLLAEYLTEHARSATGEPIPVPIVELHAHMRELIGVYGKHWRKAARELGAERELVDRALLHLEGLGLIERSETEVLPRPAIGRYAIVDAEQTTIASSDEPAMM